MVFDAVDPFVQCFFGVSRSDGDRFLKKDRPGIDPFINEVDRDTGHLDAMLQSIAHSGRSGKRRQECRVDIENPVTVGADQRAPQNPHESRENHGVNLAGFEDPQQSLVVLFPGRILARGQDKGVDAGAFGAFQGERVFPVGDDEGKDRL